jgi:glycosyltransferase involved in cell wall biosynthesis
MKVLMFGWEFPPHISGGLGTACFGLTKGLVDKGTEVIFVLPKVKGDPTGSHVQLVGANLISIRNLEERIRAFKESIKMLEIDSPLTPYLSEKEYFNLLEHLDSATGEKMIDISSDLSGLYGPDLMSEIIRYSVIAGTLANQENFDVIHAHDWMTYSAGIEAKRVSGRPLVVHAHALEFDRSGENINQDVYDIEKTGMEAADRVIAVSHYTKDRIVQRYGIPEDKVRVVHNAVTKEKTIERLHIQKNFDEKIVLFLGRITFQKGPEYFIEAAKKVIDKIPGVRFVMAGSGDMFPRMIEMAASLRIGSHFHFTGFLKGQEVEKMYAMSDLYVMPSVSEPFGIAPLEAILYDIPIIVSKQSGVAEVLDHAVKLDFWDTEKLADNIISLLTHPELAEEMVTRNREQLSQIKWEIAAEKTIAVYNELTGSN